ncbi:23S ribosomal RNA methyltransferase Erm [Leucobacter luti]|uniref:23S ribosomal RNA methyltransferase Erm n=1 Tax=Leucobacter luti TaxID=340320 RepID=UPI003D044DD4
MPQSMHGGRHELGQNFLTHSPSIATILSRVAATRGPILELGAGDGALTERLAALGRPVTAIDIDEHRTARLARRIPGARVECADALRFPLRAPTIVGNIPFHLTTPILRRLLASPDWTNAILITQWEVARKRAGVGGRTMMTAQHAPWFTFELRGRIPSWGFSPRPSVDGGVLEITRRGSPLVPEPERHAYQHFVRSVFSGRGGTIRRIVERAARADRGLAGRALTRAGIPPAALPRDLTPEQWAALWSEL